MSNSQKPSDKELLATLIEKIGAEPREAKFDDEGHLIELNFADLSLKRLPPEIGISKKIKRL